MGNFHFSRIQRLRVYAETVVLGSDFNFPCLQILNRLVCAAVAKFQFIGLGAVSQAQNLVPQADAEDRFLAQQFANRINNSFDSGRVTGAVGKENAVRIHCHNLIGRGGGGYYLHLAAVGCEASGLVEFEAEVEGYYFIIAFPRGSKLVSLYRRVVGPAVWYLTSNFPHQIAAN